MSKKEERLKRNLEKAAKKNDKSSRLAANIEIPDKFIRSSVKPELSKIPRSASPDNHKDYYFAWCDTHADIEGSWSWNESRQWTDVEYAEIIKPQMVSHNNNSWNELELKTYNGKGGFRKRSNKYQSLASLCNEAQIRWFDLEILSQFEELFRFRLGTDRRVWGIRILHHFYLVWYERDHRICPL
jgi:hypothetical protein